jgi:hypothetical protein
MVTRDLLVLAPRPCAQSRTVEWSDIIVRRLVRDVKEVWTAYASKSLHIAFERLEGGRKRL